MEIRRLTQQTSFDGLSHRMIPFEHGEYVAYSQHLASLAAQQEEIDRLKAELAMVDEALARRPAVADSPNRYTSICAAFNMASRTEKAESMEKHWKFHFDRLEAENAKLQARLAARAKTEATEHA